MNYPTVTETHRHGTQRRRFIVGSDSHAATGIDASSRQIAEAIARHEIGMRGTLRFYGTRYRDAREGRLI